MRPGIYRGASAIFYVNNQRGILMDCAEGSYGQLCDHFLSPEKINDAILKTKVIFITHIHGDHQLGMLKILQERDNLMKQPDNHAFGKIYVVVPTPMFEYVQMFVD